VNGPGNSPDYVDDSIEVPCTIDAPLDQNHRVARDCVIGPLVTVEGFLLNAEAARAYQEMRTAAARDGITLFIVSAYRPFDVQWQLYWAEVAKYGPDQNTSAKPGHSEHQLGTTVDLNDLSEEFGDTPAGRWLQENGWLFGFRLSYPRGQEDQTGYAYEPWHWRYWGR
jgi:D-alanyl-D-alanine carboxypeptidase